jgi:hypothetical protein
MEAPSSLQMMQSLELSFYILFVRTKGFAKSFNELDHEKEQDIIYLPKKL